ncbi:MAG: indolepyruvate ferredoxin oxidoreductase subunit alpha [Deltaproteobacteria bacterium]|nr:indolepyruvate ferredoxin oxidoreductase subunit alpha [Deltaproteobacteria bacterium]
MLLVGNEAIARGALEAGISVAAAYPGTPATEIMENLSKAGKTHKLYVEWSANEKVAMEVAAAGSYAGLRSLTAMKQCGVNVAADFLVHLALSGTRGGMIMIPCDDPGAIASINEEESRLFAQLVEVPLIEPCDAQEAKDMIKYAVELSEAIHNIVMVRSVTRLSHASGTVLLGEIPERTAKAEFKSKGFPLDPDEGVVMPMPVAFKHESQQKKLEEAIQWFESSPFNRYEGPDSPDLLIVTSSVCYLYSREAVQRLGLTDRVGILKLGTTWPLPPQLVEENLRRTDRVLVVEETLPVMENSLKALAMDLAGRTGIKTFYGKADGLLPKVGELNVELVAGAVARVLDVEHRPAAPAAYVERATEIIQGGAAPTRSLTFCPGCPHRASLWSLQKVLELDNRNGFVCGDIGCYGMDLFGSGYGATRTIHAMGSGTGLASGFGKLSDFGMDQTVLSVSGDSTFFHTVLPALVNAIHNQANITVVVLDNSGTAMTGFQPHPGLPVDAFGKEVPAIDIAAVSRAMGARVETCDPFDPEETQRILLDLVEDENGVKVLILKQSCALSPEKKGRKAYDVKVNDELCLGQDCGCNRLCTRILKCPGMVWDEARGKARVDEALCVGCGFCASICPQGAIEKKEVA